MRCFRIIADDSTGEPTSGMIYFDPVEMGPYDLYTVAFWGMVDGNEAETRPLRVNVKSAISAQTFHVSDIVLDSTDWKEYTVSFLSSAAADTEVEIGLGISGTATNFWIDDIRFFQGSPSDEFLPGDVSGDGAVTAYDAALALQFVVGLATPTDMERRAADMSGDGNVRSNDAIFILREVAGLAAPSAGPMVNSGRMVTIGLAEETQGAAGETVTAPLTVDRIDSLAGGDVSITYDAALLRAVGVSSEPEIMLASNIAEPGIVRISFIGAERLKSDTVARIQFVILADAASTLHIRSADLYSPDGLPLIAGRMDRTIVSRAMPPEQSALLQNFPNPFNPDTWIPYHLREDNEVIIRIFDMRGELVREFDLGFRPAGLYTNQDRALHWDGTNDAGETVSSGVYFYNITAGEFSAVKKLTILR